MEALSCSLILDMIKSNTYLIKIIYLIYTLFLCSTSLYLQILSRDKIKSIDEKVPHVLLKYRIILSSINLINIE